jgi:hypothetical protein
MYLEKNMSYDCIHIEKQSQIKHVLLPYYQRCIDHIKVMSYAFTRCIYCVKNSSYECNYIEKTKAYHRCIYRIKVTSDEYTITHGFIKMIKTTRVIKNTPDVSNKLPPYVH